MCESIFLSISQIFGFRIRFSQFLFSLDGREEPIEIIEFIMNEGQLGVTGFRFGRDVQRCKFYRRF